MDAFYSSAEETKDPSLVGKPVIVGADPKGGKARGVVMSCSYEARRMGVRSAMPISMAYRLCPNGIYMLPDFTLYEQLSDEVMTVLRGFSEKIEQVSIDEAFLDISDRAASMEAAAELAQELKKQVLEHTKLSCSIGIAPNKSVAKIASDYNKPNGLTVVKQDNVREFLAPLPVSKISGVGKKSSETLAHMSIKTIGELASTHPSKLSDVFGKYGARIWQIANGIDEEEVASYGSIKSISSESTFDEDVADRGVIMEAFDSIIQDVHRRLEGRKMLFRTVGIKVRLESFETFTRAKTHTRYTNEKAVVNEYVTQLFREFENPPRKVRLVGVRLSNLRTLGSEQETILSWTDANSV